METLKNISENYKLQCKEKALSENEIARRSGLPLEVVRNIEHGVETRIWPILQVAEVFEMSINDFVAPPKKG